MNLLIFYYAVVSLFLIALSTYDIKHLKLSMKLYYCFIPVALFSIYPNLLMHNFDIAYVLTISIITAFILYGTFFLVSLLSNGGLGGGDVKLFPLLGFIYGAQTIELLIIMVIVTALVSLPIYLYKKHKISHGYKITTTENKNTFSQEDKINLILKSITKNTNIPYIPFMTAGAIGTNIYIITSLLI